MRRWLLALMCAACGQQQPANGVPALDASADTPATSDLHCIIDVPKHFVALPDSLAASRYLGAHNDGVIPWPRYTTSADNLYGVGEHFQGIQRTGRHLIVTGGVKNGAQMSQLIVVEMGSRTPTGSWNLPAYGYDYTAPATDDRIAAVIDLDPIRWHAGGLQIWKQLAAVPLFGDSGSEVRFFDVGDPTHPSTLPPRIERGAKIAYAVALTQQGDDRYLVVVWNDVDLDFYRSRSADLSDGFDAPITVSTDSVAGGFQGGGCGITGCGTYQNLNFIRDCDGTLFLVGMRNTEKGAPAVAGNNLASLYRVIADPPALSFVDRRTITCADEQCSFAAGAGIYVDDREHLMLYATPHWLHDGNARYNFNEYSSP